MKKRKRIALVLLAAALLLSLSGCGTFETRMANAARKMAKLQSLRMDMDLDMSMKLSLFGEALDLDAEMDGQADILLDPVKMSGSLRTEILDEEQKALFFLEQGGDSYTVSFSMDDGDTWVSREAQRKEPEKQNAAETIGALAKLAASFEESGTEEIRGSAATVYDGVIAGEDVKLALENTGVLAALGEALHTELDPAALPELSSIPASVAIDNKSGMLVRYTMDLTDIMQDLTGTVTEQLLARTLEAAGLGELNLAALGLKMEFTDVKVTVDLYDFDAVEQIEAPQSAPAL